MARTHTVKAGEHLARIARQYGMRDWKSLYDAPENADLRQRRPNPFLLMPGDEVRIPEAAPRQAPAATGRQSTFNLRKSEVTLKLRLRDDGPEAGPLANARFLLEVEGVEPRDGHTDGDGGLEVPVPMDAEEAKLTVWPTEQHPLEWTLELSHLTPADDESGLRARLNNLGYECGEPDAASDETSEQVQRAFQQAAGLQESEPLGPQTRARLEREHGC